jgi:hypothetical protein
MQRWKKRLKKLKKNCSRQR